MTCLLDHCFQPSTGLHGSPDPANDGLSFLQADDVEPRDPSNGRFFNWLSVAFD